MDAKIKAKWVKALRSGKYKQGKGQLKNERGGYCCLGVLCEVMRAECHPENGIPTRKVLRAAGLRASQAVILAKMNDGGGFSEAAAAALRPKRFKTIANWIEANL